MSINKKSTIAFANDIEGYYWMSSSDSPQIVSLGDTLKIGISECMTSDDLPKTENYVVAAFFCRYKNNKPHSSIHIRFVDGNYICDECLIPENEYGQVFLGVKGLPKLRFIQLWEKIKKEYDDNIFETLIPGKSLFIGFQKGN